MSNTEKSLVPHRRFKEFENAGAWEQRKLGELANIVRGASPRPIKDPKWFDESSDVGWLRISDVTEQNGRVHYISQHISKLGEEKTRVLTKPHILLSIAATVGKPLINYCKTGVHDGFLIFQNPQFNLEFMFQWLTSFESTWRRYGQSGSQVNLNSDIVRNQIIAIPSIGEQKKIGVYLATIDILITLHQRKLNKLKKLKSAYLTEMFPAEGERKPKRRFAEFTDDWEQRKVSDVAERLDNLRIPVAASKRKKGAIPYYGANGIQDYVVGFTHNGENVLIAEDGANDLDNYPVRFVKGKIWVNNHAHVLKSHENSMDNRFLVFALKKANIPKYLVGGSRAKLNADILMNICIKVPCLEEQKLIGSLLESIGNLITLHRRKIDKLKKLKLAYLNEMFV